MGIFIVTVKIKGTTPLLCHAFTDAAQMRASEGTSISTVGDRGTPREQAESCLYKGSDGKPVIPQPNLFRCIIDGGIFFKAGKSKVTTGKSSMVPACIEIEGLEFPIIHRDPWTVDSRAVVIPSTSGRITRHRAKFNDWELNFVMSIDTDMISAKLAREIVDAAGKRIGLGDFRPAKKGPFGKFVVAEWKERIAAKAA